MTLETFYEHFELLADAPNAVPKLREVVLQLAVRGKLVEQEGAAAGESLGQLIEKGKQTWVQAKRFGMPKPVVPLSQAEQPFRLPDGWNWLRLSEVGFIVGGGTPRSDNPSNFADEGIPWLTPADLYGLKEKYISRGRRDISEAGLSISSAQLMSAGSVLFSSRAPIGYVAIAANDLATNQGFKSCVPFVAEMSEYVYWFLKSAAKEIDANASGTTFKEVSGKQVGLIPIPVPPLEEQKRIVAKVDELMALCDDLEQKQRARAEGRSRLNVAVLTELSSAPDENGFRRAWERVGSAFDALYSTPETIADLRKTVLQLAVQGKLVRQDTLTPSREITLEELLREPSRNGLSPKPSDGPPGTPILRISAATSRDDAVVDENDFKYLEVGEADLERFRLERGDLLACRFNGNLRYVGKFALYKNTSGETRLYPDKLIRFRVDNRKALPEFIRLAMNSPSGRVKIEAFCATTAGNIGISATNLKTISLMLPDIPTQKRIVAKVDELMALLDELEAGLVRARGDAERLLEAVLQGLHEAVPRQPVLA